MQRKTSSFMFAVESFHEWRTVYRSYPIPKERNPFWGVTDFCLGPLSNIPLCDLLMRVTVFDCNTIGKHKVIGHFDTPIKDLIEKRRQMSFPLLGHRKRAGFVLIESISRLTSK
mmetsp:Transcript_4037/g.5141  ORF Transcript_4037/g.5141 Transcript_4037/m.5141 type:complete len:114 (+) Transcript_4037:745-1086(+)